MSHQYMSGSDVVVHSLPGTSVPSQLQQGRCRDSRVTVTQSLVSAPPSQSTSDLLFLQEADPLLKDLLLLWRGKAPPTSAEQLQLPRPAMAFLQ